ncbi:hypothetical protein D3C86_1771520 [compost metagenome]
MPGQHRVAGGIQQHAKRGLRDGPGRRVGAAHQVTSFGEVMLDQARLVRLKGTANPATQPAPVFQVGQIVEDGFHEHHRLDNDIHYYLIMTINTIAKPDQDFAKRFFYGPLND